MQWNEGRFAGARGEVEAEEGEIADAELVVVAESVPPRVLKERLSAASSMLGDISDQEAEPDAEDEGAMIAVGEAAPARNVGVCQPRKGGGQ